MKRLTWLLFFSALCSPLMAATPLDAGKVQKSVVFIYAAKSGGADERRPIGTGFLVGVHLKADPAKSLLLLVTARHIVDPGWMFCSAPQPDLVYVRLNKRRYDPSKDSTGVAYLPVTLVENSKKRYFVSDDDKVDAAVVDFGSADHSQDDYDFQPMGLNVFAAPDEIEKLGIGDSIASAGLIPASRGKTATTHFSSLETSQAYPARGCG